MKFEKHLPTERLRPYIKHFAVSEGAVENEYKVFPHPGLVMGFQYKGRLSAVSNGTGHPLAPSGITGISGSYKVYQSSAGIGTILVYFTETGFAHFAPNPANELFDLSVCLDDLFNKRSIREAEAQLAEAATDRQRIRIVERFLLSQLRHTGEDRHIAEAVRIIYQSKGTVRMKELRERLFLSQSPLEKRFRKAVGATPKKFAAIVRFHSVLHDLGSIGSLTAIGYENHFFDQAHFIRDFKQFTGDTPESFRRRL